MSPVTAGALSGTLTFIVAELVCRLVLHLPDGTVPLVVFPSTGIVAGATASYFSRRTSRRG